MEGYASGFVAELAGQGYAPPSATLRLRQIAQLSDWLAAEDSCHQDQGPRSYTNPWDTIAYLQRNPQRSHHERCDGLFGIEPP